MFTYKAYNENDQLIGTITAVNFKEAHKQAHMKWPGRMISLRLS